MGLYIEATCLCSIGDIVTIPAIQNLYFPLFVCQGMAFGATTTFSLRLVAYISQTNMMVGYVILMVVHENDWWLLQEHV